jgi:hypothetical protein
MYWLCKAIAGSEVGGHAHSDKRRLEPNRKFRPRWHRRCAFAGWGRQHRGRCQAALCLGTDAGYLSVKTYTIFACLVQICSC